MNINFAWHFSFNNVKIFFHQKCHQNRDFDLRFSDAKKAKTVSIVWKYFFASRNKSHSEDISYERAMPKTWIEECILFGWWNQIWILLINFFLRLFLFLFLPNSAAERHKQKLTISSYKQKDTIVLEKSKNPPELEGEKKENCIDLHPRV